MKRFQINRISLIVLSVGLLSLAFGGCRETSSGSRKKTSAKETSEQLLAATVRTTLRDFGPEVLKGYVQCSDLKADIELAGRQLAYAVIKMNKDQSKQVMTSSGGAEDMVMSDAVSTAAPMTAEESSSSQGVTNAADSAASGSDKSGFETNNQVSGVDEGDLAKSDGKYLYIAYGRDLILQDLAGNLLDRVSLPIPDVNNAPTKGGSAPGMPQADSAMSEPYFGGGNRIDALILEGSKVVVVSNSYDYTGTNVIIGEATQIYLYAVSSEGKLTLAESKQLNGSYQALRKVDGSAYLVTLANLNNYELIGVLYRYNFAEGITDEAYLSQAMTKTNELLPVWSANVMKELVGEEPYAAEACLHIVQINNMHRPTTQESQEPSADPVFEQNPEVLSSFGQIASFHIATGLTSLKRSGMFLPGYALIAYANQSNLMLSARGWSQTETHQWESDTFLISYLLQEGQALPQAIGVVPGYILNQFSMDIYQNHLRIASTIDAQWGVNAAGNWEQTVTSESVVSILQIVPEQLIQTGQVRGLGKGERIYATRFLASKGYVVTFKQTDPFYTLDLSDPQNPKEVGELKIPGFSNYLHPIDEQHILAIGQDANAQGWGGGLQIAVFDVSALSNPQQAFKYVVPGWSSSNAQYDHRAFRYYAPKQALILPLSYYSNQDQAYFNGFQLFKISLTEGITAQSKIKHATRYCYEAELAPRSFIFENQLVTLKAQSVLSHDFNEALSSSGTTLTAQWKQELNTPSNCYY
ncbi:beta-propeller domain-containing protein [Deltaproteobacteria bacterium TL4]